MKWPSCAGVSGGQPKPKPGEQQGSQAQRTVQINLWNGDRGVRDNYTSTTKYSLLTFLPRALFEQYRRLANIYFTAIAALSVTPFSPVRPWTTFTPLVIVLGASLIKEAMEDYKRYKADLDVNQRMASVLDSHTGGFVQRRWAEVKVGDIVEVRKDDFIPADLLLLCSSSVDGTCYVETMNLDGETNLKIKTAVDCTKTLDRDSLNHMKGTVQCEGPNARLYVFTGNLEVPSSDMGAWAREQRDPQPAGGRLLVALATIKTRSSMMLRSMTGHRAVPEGPVVVPLTAASMLLRGCSLRNTAAAYGTVIYAGHDTKVMQNSTRPPSKRSRLEHAVDWIILAMFTLLTLMCIVTAVVNVQWTKNDLRRVWYLKPQDTTVDMDPGNPTRVGLVSFVISLILYGYLIPISLYVSIEVVKITQAMVFIAQDRSMYHEETDTPALARTSNLNEELGMVTTVLSDKTGTLTRNVMEFFKCSIAGVAYGAGVTEIERANAARRGIALPDGDDPAAHQWREQFFNFYDKRLMGTQWTHEEDPETIAMFFRLLAVCHTIVPDGPADEKLIKYEAESPDEAALVVGAKVFGFFFCKRTNTSVTVRERSGSGSKEVEYEVLNVLEFNSTRKRMSVIIREKGSGKLIIFCKGADTVIYERLDPKHPNNVKFKGPTTTHMEDFGSAGLRTLCLAYTELDPAFYEPWAERFYAAKTSLEDRADKMAAVSEEIERNLRLLGCTAIEDKLQDGVPQAIKQLARAGIRLWVLTGDKMETAINIGFACSLITEQMQQLVLHVAPAAELPALAPAAGEAKGAAAGGTSPRTPRTQLDEDEAACLALEKQMDAAFETLHAMRDAAAGMHGGKSKGAVHPAPMSAQGAAGTTSNGRAALIIDGRTLSFALGKRLKAKFLELGSACHVVMCCRVSPLQKAQVTALVRSKGDVTLAIGDGANDVGMIQEAHIGVGISGQEGMQAVMSSDFAIAQFRFLVPLLLVHGRWNYKRISRMVLFFFYKNMLFGVTLFIYNMMAASSGSYIYSDTTMALFNVIFTSMAPFVIGMFDRDVDRATALANPGLYQDGQRNASFSPWRIGGWVTTGLLHAGLISVMVLGIANPLLADRAGGQTPSLDAAGIAMYNIVILTVHMQLAVVTEQFTWLHHAATFGSMALWYVYLLAFGALPISWSLQMYKLFSTIVAPNACFWLLVVVVPHACVLPSVFGHVLKRQCWPSDIDILQEVEQQQRQQRQQQKRHGHEGGEEGQHSKDGSRFNPLPGAFGSKVAPLPTPPPLLSSTDAAKGFSNDSGMDELLLDAGKGALTPSSETPGTQQPRQVPTLTPNGTAHAPSPPGVQTPSQSVHGRVTSSSNSAMPLQGTGLVPFSYDISITSRAAEGAAAGSPSPSKASPLPSLSPDQTSVVHARPQIGVQYRAAAAALAGSSPVAAATARPSGTQVLGIGPTPTGPSQGQLSAPEMVAVVPFYADTQGSPQPVDGTSALFAPRVSRGSQGLLGGGTPLP